jgi:putative spermidine/putrescine transport system ATP-binding protein
MAEPQGGRSLVVDAVTHRYPSGALAVENINLDIKGGEIIALLGPSGCGKTTLLRIIAGFIAQTQGRIIIGDDIVDTLPPNRRAVGIVFQNYALFPHLSISENVAYGLAARGIDKATRQRESQRLLELVQLPTMAERLPRQLSGGQQQRVALARALVFDPELVLMDEPLGALDKQLREHMQLEIKHLQQRLGLTVVFVTHDQAEALTMSDRVAVFDKGVIQQIDSAEALYERPANSFVAGFIGENNALRGTIADVRGEHCTVQLDGGARVEARVGNVGRAGERTQLSMRPERAYLVDGEIEPNQFSARVTELIYLGDHVRVRMQLADQQEFSIKTPISQLRQGLRAGENVRVALPAEHLRALDLAEAA